MKEKINLNVFSLSHFLFITFIVPYHIIVQFTNSSEYIHLLWHCILKISGDILHIPSVVFTDVLIYCIGRTIYQAL